VAHCFGEACRLGLTEEAQRAADGRHRRFDGLRAGLLGELLSARIEGHRHVEIAGCRKLEQALQVDLPRRRVE
jgi:hypothetical protein